MKVTQVLKPKRPWNLRVTLVVCLVLTLVYAGGSLLWPWSPKRGLGLAFGILAAALFSFEMLYPARRPRARPLFTAQNWVQAHVYLGVVALCAAVIHAGGLPRGALGWWLFLLASWTTLTGLLGVWLQKWIPPALAEGLHVEALYERIPSLVEHLVGEADELMKEASDVLARFYRTEVREGLAKLSPSWGFLLDVRAGRQRALEPLQRMTRFVDPAERERVNDLLAIYTEKMELDAHYSLQGLLKRWLIIHAPTAGLLMGLLAVHIFGWLWY